MARRRKPTEAGEGLVRMADAARRSGVTVNQLQYYLYMDVVKPTAVSDGEQRLFDSAAIRRIHMARMLNESGYPLREIREIFMERRYRKGAKGKRRRKKR